MAEKKTKKSSPAKVAERAVTVTKHDVIAKHAIHEKDTGSSQVQVAILTSRIEALQGHLKSHVNDTHSKKGLLTMIGKRRKHLDYLRAKKPEIYNSLIDELGLRK